MDGGRSSAVATFFSDAPLDAGRAVELDDAEAHHARVRRLTAGTRVRLLDGAGTVAEGTLSALTKRDATVHVDHVTHVPPLSPVHLIVPVADRDRMLWLAEKATELGLTSWRAVMWARSRGVAPRGAGPSFHAKLRARAVAALAQSGGAWLPALLPDTTVDDLETSASSGARLLLDPGGEPMLSAAQSAPMTITVGPEGGLEDQERERLVRAGWIPVSLGTATLRFETAGIAALAIARAALATTVENARG